MATKTLILYRTHRPSAPGWEERLLLPSRSLVDILAVEHDYSGRMPQEGERVPEFENLEDPGYGATHFKEGDWVVTHVHRFSSPDTNERIIVCYCEHQPIDAVWQDLKRGKPVDEILHPVEAK